MRINKKRVILNCSNNSHLHFDQINAAYEYKRPISKTFNLSIE